MTMKRCFGWVRVWLLLSLAVVFLTHDLKEVSAGVDAGKQTNNTLENASAANNEEGCIAIVNMDMMILPGTLAYLERSLEQAYQDHAKLVILELDTPGGMLNTAQEMIQAIFNSRVPIVVYVTPSGSTATSAGVFITLAGHVAAMAPGTSIGAAHPVTGEGKDIEGDMRSKAENMTVAMVKSISEERGRNVDWAEKAVKESDSVTEKEALGLGVVDIVAPDLDELLKNIAGRRVKLGKREILLEDYSRLPRRSYEMQFKHKALNVLANPNIAALLWLAATTGISLELYNPGSILPGVVGVICLILALAVSQIIPISQSGVILMVVGALMIGAEMYTGVGILGVGGVVAMVLGAVYLIDVSQAPGLSVALEFIVPMAVLMGGLALWVVHAVVTTYKHQESTGAEGIVGMTGKAVENIVQTGRVLVRGEYWKAVPHKDVEGVIAKGEGIEVVRLMDGLVLEVRRQA
jgi:membrane-bound serine protease (ClpP class)